MSNSTMDDVGPGYFTIDYTRLTNVVDCCILILTILGAGGVIVSILVKEYIAGRGSTIRSRLVLFLVFGDFMLGIIGIIPVVATISGHPPVTGSDFCDANGFLLASALWAQHFNTLSLAVATYLILIYPLSSWTRIVERRWRWFLPLVWIASFVMSAVAWAVQQRWAYSQGLCFYRPGLFGVVYQFIPRGIVFATITVLYFRLFIFLRRPDKIRSSTSLQGRDTSETTTDGNSTGSRIRRHTSAVVRSVRGSFAIPHRSLSVGEASGSRTSRISEGDESATGVISGAMRKLSVGGADPEDRVGGPKDIGRNTSRPPPVGAEQTEIPQWERLELPTFEGSGIDGPSTAPIPTGWTWGLKKGGGGVFGGAGEGAGSKGMGGNPTPNLSLLKPPLPPPPAHPSLKRQSSFAVAGSPRLGMDGFNSLRRNSDTPAYLNHQHLQDLEEEGEPTFTGVRRGSRVSFVDSHTNIISASTPLHYSPLKAFPTIDLPPHSLASTFQFPPSPATNVFPPTPQQPYTFGHPPARLNSSPPSPTRETYSDSYYPLTTFHTTFGSSEAPSVVAELTHLSQDVSPKTESGNPLHTNLHYNDKNNNSYSTRRSSEATGMSFTAPYCSRTKDVQEHDRTTDETLLDEDDEDIEWSLERILEMTQPPTTVDGRTWEPREQGGSEEAATGSDGQNFESTSKFMNRKASLLMLTFPLAYIVLFSVSLIRIIYDFVSPTPQPILIAVSRWFVFSQGLADALIYGLIEWKVKRTVRRRNRATGRHASATGSASRQPSASVPNPFQPSRK